MIIFVSLTLLGCFASCRKSGSDDSPLNAILGTYVGTVHFTYQYTSGWYPARDSSYDTTYSFTFTVSRVSGDTFTTNHSCTACVFMGLAGNSGYFVYDSSSTYRLIYFGCPDTYGSGGGGSLTFSPYYDSVWYGGAAVDQEGGGQVFSLSCTETFSGKKL